MFFCHVHGHTALTQFQIPLAEDVSNFLQQQQEEDESGESEKHLAPRNTALQNRVAKELYFPPVPATCVVTGGTGFVGQRLVEMLVERGAKRVVSLDIVPKPEEAWDHPNIEWIVGDITDPDVVNRAVKGADCVWHNTWRASISQTTAWL